MSDDIYPLLRLKILVIDDEEDFLEDFEKLVKGFNHKMTGTTDSTEALELVEKSYAELNPFDVVFIDYLMLNLNGVEMARKLKAIDPDLILIAITRDESIRTKMKIVDSLLFRLLIPKSIPRKRLARLFDVLLSTKMRQNSGDESRLAQKLNCNESRSTEQAE